MKELSIEEKAKRYDEAIKVATDIKAGTATYIKDGTLVIDAIFPELAESEDEKIRKWLIYYFKEVCDNVSEKEKKGVLAYLEKQAEQKPAWSREDETLLNCCLGAINTTDYFDKDNKDKMKDWLYNRFKSLKPQNRWKPTGEQIKALDNARHSNLFNVHVLDTLFHDLKKLREE